MSPAPVGQDPLDAGRLRQGAIVWIHPEDAPEVVPTHPHPHVIVQDDLFNRSRITTVVVCALTSNLRRADEPGNILLEPGEGGLPRQSVVVVSQISSVEKARVGQRIGQLSPERVVAILDGLRFQQRGYFGDR
ncbi:MAG TPA: type II toxin-antitoxin system PemK/MazF family toxin [Myxococcaceae bacterium]|nr:type II toxin-antitoxin system PemK/MazF family toxin [Myxococcaceae bacterium]